MDLSFFKPVMAAVVAAILTVASLASGTPAPAAVSPPPPNVVLITVDDMPESMFNPALMPRTHGRAAGGTRFTDFIATTPLCCPFRATLLTGQYGHNNGVLRNDYSALRKPNNVLPAWLGRAGYRTAHLGKFLNGYDRVAGEPRTAPGWDRWFTQYRPGAYYGWKAFNGKKLKRFGDRGRSHLTGVIGGKAAQLARRMASGKAPYFLQTDFFAPHVGSGRDQRCNRAAVPQARDEHRFDDLDLPESANFNEADVSDKPPRIANLAPLGASKIADIERKYRCSAEAVYSVDRQIERIFKAIDRGGEADRTIVIFTSDNGFFRGEHRIPGGKAYPYEENLKLPLVIWAPEAYRAPGDPIDEVGRPVASIDIAPTVLDWAGAEPCRGSSPDSCRYPDGRSLSPLLEGRLDAISEDRSLIVELRKCTYRGIRQSGEVFFIYADRNRAGDCVIAGREHYELDADPAQLDNLYPAAPEQTDLAARQAELQAEIERLRDCSLPEPAAVTPHPEGGEYCE